MATLIRLKRKKSTGTTNSNSVKLHAGEPVYNLEEKKLYIGNTTADDTIPEKLPRSQKHIAEITAIDEGDAVVKFTVGEATGNEYSKTVNNVAVSKGLILNSMYYGNESKRNNLAKAMGVDKVPAGTVFFQEAE